MRKLQNSKGFSIEKAIENSVVQNVLKIMTDMTLSYAFTTTNCKVGYLREIFIKIDGLGALEAHRPCASNASIFIDFSEDLATVERF